MRGSNWIFILNRERYDHKVLSNLIFVTCAIALCGNVINKQNQYQSQYNCLY